MQSTIGRKEVEKLKKFLRRSALAIKRDDYYVTYQNAALWIAYGVSSWPGSSPLTLEETLKRWENRHWVELDEEFNPPDRYEWASEQLQSAVRSGRLHLIAKYRDHSPDDLVPRGYVAPA